jgi:hypothetical protein
MAFDKTKYLKQRIDDLFVLADACDSYETKSELASFAAVLTSGLIESSCRRFLLRFTVQRSHTAVARYVESKMYFFQNAKTSQIEELLGFFDPDFARQFNADLTEDELAAVNSVVTNKNHLAHGENPGLGLEVMSRYYRLCLSAIKKIERICT